MKKVFAETYKLLTEGNEKGSCRKHINYSQRGISTRVGGLETDNGTEVDKNNVKFISKKYTENLNQIKFNRCINSFLCNRLTGMSF
jgi:hypothetical protein